MASISYKPLQESGLVQAAIVGSFTEPNVRQLILFKEMALEIWETKEENPINVSTTRIRSKVCNCAVLQNPWGYTNLSSTTLDRILVIDDKGNINALEWSISGVTNIPLKVVGTNKDKVHPLLYHSIFSKPLRLRGDTPLSSLIERSREKEDGAKDWFGKIKSITLVAMAVYHGFIQVLVAAWIPNTHYQKTDFQETIPHRPLLNEYHLKMKEEPRFDSIVSQLQKEPTILDLAFMECLDWKAHPLLVVLSAQDGLIYELVTVECFVLDLAEGKIHQGPWRISNLHASSRFLLPWCQDGIKPAQHNCDVATMASKSAEGMGVLVISSRGVLFINLEGCRASLHFTMHLDGLPSCVEIIKDHCLALLLSASRLWVKQVLGDSSGVLYVADLKQWDQHLIHRVKESSSHSPANILLLIHAIESERRDMENFMLFSSGKTSSLRFFKLHPPLLGEAVDTQEGPSWYTTESLMEHDSDSDFTCVRDMILINEPQQQQLIVIACGSAPDATIRRGSFDVLFNEIRLLDDKVYGLPRIIPIKWNVHSEYHTHILLSYVVEDRTEIISVDGEIENESYIQGLEREHSTLAALVMFGEWLVQVTSCSLRVLSIFEPRVLVAEWIPPTRTTSNVTADGRLGQGKKLFHSIVHASLCMEGAILATGAILYSVTLTKGSGRVQTSSTNIRDHEVSALGIFDFYITGESIATKKKKKLYARELTNAGVSHENGDLFFIVVVAQWYTNTVHLLTWPGLEEMTSIEPRSAPVRCAYVTTLGNKQHLIVGTSDGNIITFEIKYEIPTRNMEAPLCQKNNYDKSLKRFGLKLLNGKRFQLGGSIEYMVSGPIFGPDFDSDQNIKLENAKCLLVQGHQIFVVCSKEDGQLQALHLMGSIQPSVASSRIHTKNLSNGLLVMSNDKRLALGHLSMSMKLNWKIARVLGTPQQLAHHHGSGCVAISSSDGGSMRLSLMSIQSMCQVLTIELGFGHHPTMLKILRLPCVKTKGDESACKECIVVASQRGAKEPSQGTIHFFEFNHLYPCDREIQYELNLLGIHSTELSCHAMCLLDSQEKSLPSGVCDICNISSFVEDFEPLDSVVKHLSNGSHHWSNCLRHQEHERGPCHPSGPFLVLGFKEHVEVHSIVVGNNMMSILLAPYLAHAVKVVVPYFSEPTFLEDYDSSSPYISENESDHEDHGLMCSHLQETKVCTHDHDQEPKSLISLTRITEFASLGGSCVTMIVAISQHNFLVVEILRGFGVFSIQDNAKVYPLAWHPLSHPILDLITLTPDLYLLCTYEEGLQLMGRNHIAEQVFQDEEKRLREEDMERGLGGASRQPGELDTNTRVHEMPKLNIIDTQPWPATGLLVLRVQEGSLNIPMETINPNINDGSFHNWCALAVTPTGEVGVIEIYLQEDATSLVLSSSNGHCSSSIASLLN